MVDFGGAIAQGISGYVKGSQMADDRNAKQQLLTQQSQEFEMRKKQFQQQQSQGKTAQQLQEEQLKQTQMQVQQMRDQLSQQKVFQAFDGGTLTDLNSVLEKDQNLQSHPLIAGVQKVEKVDMSNPEFANVANQITTNGGEPILVSKVVNGKIVQQVGDLSMIKHALGYSTFKVKREAELNSLKEQVTTTSIKANESANMLTWLQANPTKTITDYKNEHLSATDQADIDYKNRPVKDAGNAKSAFELGNLKTEAAMVDAVDSNKDAFNTRLDSEDKNAPLGNSTLYKVATAYENSRNKEFGKIDTKTKDSLNTDIRTIKQLNTIKDYIKTADIDYNAITKLQGEINKKFGNWTSWSEDDKANVKKFVALKTKQGIVGADYIFSKSGAAVPEGERDMYNNLLFGGEWSDGTALEAALNASTDTLGSGLQDKGRALKNNYPRTFLDLRDRMTEAGVKFTPESKSGAKASDFDN